MDEKSGASRSAAPKAAASAARRAMSAADAEYADLCKLSCEWDANSCYLASSLRCMVRDESAATALTDRIGGWKKLRDARRKLFGFHPFHQNCAADAFKMMWSSPHFDEPVAFRIDLRKERRCASCVKEQEIADGTGHGYGDCMLAGRWAETTDEVYCNSVHWSPIPELVCWHCGKATVEERAVVLRTFRFVVLHVDRNVGNLWKEMRPTKVTNRLQIPTELGGTVTFRPVVVVEHVGEELRSGGHYIVHERATASSPRWWTCDGKPGDREETFELARSFTDVCRCPYLVVYEAEAA